MLSSRFRKAIIFNWLLLAFLFNSTFLFAAGPSVATYDQPAVKSYEQLLDAIRAAHHASEERIEQAVEAEKVREAWETGHLIQEHILLNQDRAKYGSQVLKHLSKDLDISERELNYMIAFARANPISPPAAKLNWSQHRELLSVDDPIERKGIEQKAEKENWTRKVLRAVIRKRKVKTTAAEPEHVKLAELSLGKIGTYQIVKIQDELKVDLGFEVSRDIPEKYARELKKGNIIVAKSGYFAESPGSKPADLFTYNAVLLDVVDGDTFHAVIDLGFETNITQRLRLRRLDAPEIISADGKQAKKFLEKILNRSRGVSRQSLVVSLVRSNDQDQYGRYLVDVWVMDKNIDQELVDSELFTIRGGE